MGDIAGYERLPGNDELESQSNTYTHHHQHTIVALDPHAVLGNELPVSWPALQNLDLFLARVYKYWEEKGFFAILTSRILNLAALAFTIFVSSFLLLFLDTSAFTKDCLRQEICSIWDVAFHNNPFSPSRMMSPWTILSSVYVLLCIAYWLFSFVHLYYELRDLMDIRHFYAMHLGLSERAVHAATWPEVARRLVRCQDSIQLTMDRTLLEHDIVNIIMRRENYLIAMLNKGVLALNVPVPGLRRHVLLTKTMEWNLYWSVLDPLFDNKFRVKSQFLDDPQGLVKRLKAVALMNAVLSPFLLLFLVMYFFMKNAEALYHHPSTLGARQWSPLARWKLREYNELPCFIFHRLNAGHDAANKYLAQFPKYVLSHVARFCAFVTGSFAALLIALTLMEERFLEVDLIGGHQTVWWLALLGVVLAASRGMIIEQSTASFDPGLAFLEVAAHTHYFPRRWQKRAHTLEVQEEFSSLFRYRFFLFLEELSSVVITPIVLWHSLPRCAPAILTFVRQNTVSVDGIGDVCSFAAFDLRKHGDGEYGSPWTVNLFARSNEGKLEKSVMSFAATYPMWDPSNDAKELLETVTTSALKDSHRDHSVDESDHHESVAMYPHDGSRMMSTQYNDYRNYQQQHVVLNLLMSQYPHLGRMYIMQQQQRYGAATNGSTHNMKRRQTLGVDGLQQHQQDYYKAETSSSEHYKNSQANGMTGSNDSASSNIFASALNGTSMLGADADQFSDTIRDLPAPLSSNERVAVGYAMLQSYHDSHQQQPGDDNGELHQESGGELQNETLFHQPIGATENRNDWLGSGQQVHIPPPQSMHTVSPAIDAPSRKIASLLPSGSGGSYARSFHIMSNELSVLSREQSGVSQAPSPQAPSPMSSS